MAYSPKFCHKVTHPPIDLSVADIRSQIAAEWLEIAQWSQWRAYRKPIIDLSNGTIADPYDLPFPKMGGPNCTHRDKFVTRAANWRLDIDEITFAYKRCRLSL